MVGGAHGEYKKDKKTGQGYADTAGKVHQGTTKEYS